MPMRRRSIAGTVARTAVVAGTATAVSGRVARRQQANSGPQAQAASAPPASAEPVEALPPEPNSEMVQLKELAELHAQGVLTDDEFAAKKALILGI